MGVPKRVGRFDYSQYIQKMSLEDKLELEDEGVTLWDALVKASGQEDLDLEEEDDTQELTPKKQIRFKRVTRGPKLSRRRCRV